MKKFLVICIAVLMVLGLVGCEEKIRVMSEEELKMMAMADNAIENMQKEGKKPVYEDKETGITITKYESIMTINGKEADETTTIEKDDKVVQTMTTEFKYKGTAHSIKFMMSYVMGNDDTRKSQQFFDGKEMVPALKKGLVF